MSYTTSTNTPPRTLTSWRIAYHESSPRHQRWRCHLRWHSHPRWRCRSVTAHHQLPTAIAPLLHIPTKTRARRKPGALWRDSLRDKSLFYSRRHLQLRNDLRSLRGKCSRDSRSKRTPFRGFRTFRGFRDPKVFAFQTPSASAVFRHWSVVCDRRSAVRGHLP